MNTKHRDPSQVLTVATWSLSPLGILSVSWVAGGPLQLAGPHLAAFAGIVVLAILGGVLLLRNRLEDRDSFTAGTGDPSEEFVTDRERVRRLITENGGRMKQSQIVDSVDWSKAKVSRLLAELEEDGHVTKLRLGRENLVCLPGNEPTASKSPEQSKTE